ncbi:alpha-D-xyloside xylohydrolase [Catenibacillus scindens]|uniref:alpha-D-xyloside xylohydrolase n=1 Tax=Catenibacillus scindens TaxID=673271 RepID=A0A7W8HA77_9FIRM|nr:alpha-xylosidase [Catenibacillus scindens]MBB5264781.1 alpha-D-xyloside xylohydrolase [Catenibacillus scindens]
MKFQNGAWLMKEGHALFSPKMIYEVEKNEDSALLVLPTRGFDLQSVVLTMKITAPAPEVIRVQTWHYMGVDDGDRPRFELNLSQNSLMEMEEDDEKIVIKSGRLALVIDRENWSMRYERDGKLLTKSGKGDLAYIKTDWKGDYYSYNGENAYMVQHLGLSVGELIYGLGERFTPLVRNGQSVDIWNEDGGTATEKSYKNIPFYLSSRGYGVFVNHTEKVSYEVGSEYVTKVSFSVPGEYLDYFVIDGPTMKEALMRYTDLTGKPALPPRWTFGLWLSTSFITSYDEKTVLGFIDGMQSRGIPLSVFHFDCLWMKNFHWTDFCWDSDIFPDPEGMLKKIHDKGVRVCVWINPYVGQRSALFKEGKEKGYFLKRENGDVWQWDMWQPGLAIVDFTNPQACRWYASQLKKLMAMGVDCFKTDFGERIPVDAVYDNHFDPVKMHNYYSYIYNKTVFETIESVRGKGEAVLFARSATAGGQKFPVHWGGDCTANYESMSESLRGGLSLTASGFGFWSHDIGGFEDNSTPDVYKRWAAFGLLSTHSRLHGSTTYRVPWNYGEEAVDTLRFFTRLKMSLMPYIYSSAVQTSRTGVPMMRAMAMEFPDDLNCAYLERQYMFGERLMVAPIFNEEGIGRFYLPKGRWTDYLTGEIFEGGAWYEKYYDYLHIPLLVRDNSIIPKGSRDDSPEYDYARDVEFRVYALKNEARAEIFDRGRKTGWIEGRTEPDTGCIVFKGESEGSWKIRMINVHISGVKGARYEIDGADTVVIPEQGQEKVWVSL